MRALVLAIALLSVSSVVSAEPYCWAERPSNLLTHPSPIHRPDAPGGRVVLSCDINENRSLACIVAEEEPAGWGYGEAALRIVSRFRICEGVTYAEPLSLPMQFVHDDAVTPAP